MSEADDYINGLYKQAEHRRRLEQAESFKSFDARQLTRLTDKALAVWQADFTPDQPQYLLADYEKQRRLNAAMIRSGYHIAGIGILGTLAGMVLGYFLR